MLGTLIKSCTTLGYRQMIAIIGDSGNAGSIRLHARHGFRLVGTLAAAGFKHGRWVDPVLIQRAPGPGAEALPDCFPTLLPGKQKKGREQTRPHNRQASRQEKG